MADFQAFVAAFSAALQPHGYEIRAHISGATPVQAVFDDVMFQVPLIAIPDIHLGDAGPGDVFMAHAPDKALRLAATLRATSSIMNAHPAATQALQLGDWFDLWRTDGGDVRSTKFGKIQNAAIYREILDLDAQIGLPHLIGNHDASFLRALPDRRVQQPGSFRLGFWLNQSVYAMHGHQTELLPPPSAASAEFLVAAATTLAEFIPGVTTFEAYVDRFGPGKGIKEWLLSCLGLLRQDPQPVQRPIDASVSPPGVRAQFVQRENREDIARLAAEVSKLPASHGRSARLVIVGHSHAPCIAFSNVPRPTVIVDAGSWAFDQANILLAANDTVGVFDVVPR
jgi:UDP-2,3-diacylglucosamine pyrophosphatase LpxH